MKKWIAPLLALVVIFGFALDARLEVTHYGLSSPKLTRPHTLAVVTDLHNSFYGREQQRLVSAISEAEPDAVLLVGDMADSLAGTDGVCALLAGLEGAYPVYYTTGNHECAAKDELDEILERLEDAGAQLLRGGSVMLGEVRIAGTDDPLCLYRQEWVDQLDACRARDDVFTLLMAHRPDRAAYYGEGFDLVVCGHAHGGQVRLPLLMENGLWAPNQGWFPEYGSGMHAVGRGQMIVSRGLCRNMLPRVFNRPELVIVRLEPGA